MENTKEELEDMIIKVKAAIFDADIEKQRLVNLLVNTTNQLREHSDKPKDI